MPAWGGREATMSRTGRVMVMVDKELVVREHPVPEPGPGTILLRQELAHEPGADVAIDIARLRDSTERTADGFRALASDYRLDGRDVVKIALEGALGDG